MKTPLVDLGTGHVVLDVVPAVLKRGTAAPRLFFAHVCCGLGRPSQLLLSSCYIMRTTNGLILMLNSLSSCLIDI